MLAIPGPPGGQSGALGSFVLSHNRYGYYLRNRVIPTNPSSTRQQEIRSIVSQISKRWSQVLTPEQRNAWDVYGNAISMSNRIGMSISLTGHAHYVRSNASRLYAGLDVVDAAPSELTLAETDGALEVAISQATQQLSVAFDTSLPWVDEDDAAMVIQMSMPSGPGTTYNQGPYRYAGTIAGDQTTPPTSPQTIAVPFPVAEGQLVSVQARILRADGRLSEPFRTSSNVAA